MAKASITKKYTLAATGILDVTDDGVSIEAADTGEMIDLRDLLSDFHSKSVKISVNYDESYE
jgi:hypothetical protein